MTPFDEELKRALARVEPPEGFTERLAAKIGALPVQAKRSAMQSWWRWAAVAAALLVMVGGAAFEREHQREVEGQAAKEKLLVAMRITGAKLQHAHQQILEVEGETH